MVPLLTSSILEPGEGRVEQVRGERRHHAAEEYLNKKQNYLIAPETERENYSVCVKERVIVWVCV